MTLSQRQRSGLSIDADRAGAYPAQNLRQWFDSDFCIPFQNP
ncbi:MAG: hypothetical protein R3D33_06275 [Hyphomicrobiaceae bacterium]